MWHNVKSLFLTAVVITVILGGLFIAPFVGAILAIIGVGMVILGAGFIIYAYFHDRELEDSVDETE